MRIILRMSRRCLTVALGMAVIGSLGACATSAPETGATVPTRIRVVAAENFWGSIAAQIAGSEADVTSVVTNPDTDPHAYEATARDARAIASANYVIENGIGYDPWAQKLLDANPLSGRTVLDVGKILGLAAGANPHQWYAPGAVLLFIGRVTADLARLDPGHRAAYRRNARVYESEGLRRYHDLLARIEQGFRGTPIGASESIVAPLADAAGLEVKTPAALLDAIAEGNEPTAADKATADAQITGRQIQIFVYNSQNATPDVQRLVRAARRARIPVATITETLTPANATFQAWQERELRELLDALNRAVRP